MTSRLAENLSRQAKPEQKTEVKEEEKPDVQDEERVGGG